MNINIYKKKLLGSRVDFHTPRFFLIRLGKK